MPSRASQVGRGGIPRTLRGLLAPYHRGERSVMKTSGFSLFRRGHGSAAGHKRVPRAQPGSGWRWSIPSAAGGGYRYPEDPPGYFSFFFRDEKGVDQPWVLFAHGLEEDGAGPNLLLPDPGEATLPLPRFIFRRNQGKSRHQPSISHFLPQLCPTV